MTLHHRRDTKTVFISLALLVKTQYTRANVFERRIKMRKQSPLNSTHVHSNRIDSSSFTVGQTYLRQYSRSSIERDVDF